MKHRYWEDPQIVQINKRSGHVPLVPYPNRDEALANQRTNSRAETILNLDHRHMGLGGASCGSPTLPEYILPPENYQFTFHLRPFSTTESDPNQLAHQLPSSIIIQIESLL